MKTSETIEALATALAAAQADMKNATLNQVNSHFRNKYADLAGIREATLPALLKHGLTITQFTAMDGGQPVLCTRLAHKSGQWMEGTYPLPMAPDRPQVMGSALTYARRYCWSAACGIVGDEDDDGEAAHGRPNGNGAKRGTNGGAISAEQKQKIISLMQEVGANATKFYEYLGVSCVDDLAASQFTRAMQALEQKRAAAQ